VTAMGRASADLLVVDNDYAGDPDAAAEVLASGMPVVRIPFEEYTEMRRACDRLAGKTVRAQLACVPKKSITAGVTCCANSSKNPCLLPG
jgi:hypothetical protein